jgi:hypothetical protein
MDRAHGAGRHRDRDQAVKLAALPMINRNADARGLLLAQIELLKAPVRESIMPVAPVLTVCIDGVRQDDTITEMVKVVVIRELEARVAALEYDLRTMGVDIPRRDS